MSGLRQKDGPPSGFIGVVTTVGKTYPTLPHGETARLSCRAERQRQSQTQIPFGDDNQKGNDNSKGKDRRGSPAGMTTKKGSLARGKSQLRLSQKEA
jgi:hypothetical protein